MSQLYAEMNQISQLWREVEQRLQGPELKLPDAKLTLERVGEGVRICWCGKPINDCKAVEKIEATFHLRSLTAQREKQNDELLLRAKEARFLLAKWLADRSDK